MKLRPFGLTDAMILVVASATALSINRLDWPGFIELVANPVDAHDTIEHFLDLVTPHLAVGTIALLAIRMRSPRPPFGRLARQPGTAGCIVALAAILVIICWSGITLATGRGLEFSEHAMKDDVHSRGSVRISRLCGRILVIYGDRIGFAVAGAWLSLWLSGRWRPEPTWIDRLGRTMAWLWLVLALVLWLRCYSI